MGLCGNKCMGFAIPRTEVVPALVWLFAVGGEHSVVDIGHIQLDRTDGCVLGSSTYGYGTQDPLRVWTVPHGSRPAGPASGKRARSCYAQGLRDASRPCSSA